MVMLDVWPLFVYIIRYISYLMLVNEIKETGNKRLYDFLMHPLQCILNVMSQKNNERGLYVTMGIIKLSFF